MCLRRLEFGVGIEFMGLTFYFHSVLINNLMGLSKLLMGNDLMRDQ